MLRQSTQRVETRAAVAVCVQEREVQRKAAATAAHVRQCLDWQVGAKRERKRRQQRLNVTLRKQFQRRDAETDDILRQQRQRKQAADRQYIQELMQQRE